MSELTPDSIIERLRANAEWAQAAALGDPHCGHIHEAEAIEWTAAADLIEQLTAERDALRDISNDVLWLTRLAVGSSWPGEMAEQVERAAARVRALLVPEDGDR